jgi:hypothetical protein
MKRRMVNMMTNRTLNSSRKMVIARHVSVIISHERSYKCSSSAVRRLPKKRCLRSRAKRRTTRRDWFPSTSALTFELDR